MKNFVRAKIERRATTTACRRSQRGAVIALVLATAFVLVAIGLACVALQSTVGSSIGLQNAVDSGALTVSRDVLRKISTPLRSTEAESQFADMAQANPKEKDVEPYREDQTDTTSGQDGGSGSSGASASGQTGSGSKGSFIHTTDPSIDPDDHNVNPNPADGNKGTRVTLSNINQVTGKALMIGMNAEGMEAQQVDTDLSREHALGVLIAASDINKRLKAAVNQELKLKSIFLQTAKANTIHALGQPAAQLSPSGGAWTTSYTDVGAPSDAQLKPAQIPDGYDPKSLHWTPDKNGYQLMNGYMPDEVLGRRLEFIPLTPHLQPHLISKTTYQTKPLGNHAGVAPNAFRMAGSITTSGMSLAAVACSQAEPIRGATPVEIKHGFVRIRVHAPRKFFIVDGERKLVGWYNQAPAKYVFFDETKTVLLEATMGNELGTEEPTLKDLLFPPSAGAANDQLKHIMGQRLAEIDSNFDENNVEAILSQRKLPEFESPNTSVKLRRGTVSKNYINFFKTPPSDFVFYVLKPDGGQMTVLEESEVLGRAPWMAPYINTQPDGVSRPLPTANLGTGKAKVLYKDPAVKAIGFQVDQTKTMTLSTGYNGLLLELSENRNSYVSAKVK